MTHQDQSLRTGVLLRIRNDLLGGLTAAVVSVPGNILFGLIAFAPLGDRYLGVGIAAAMVSSIVISLSSALLGGMPAIISGPKGPTALIFASLLARLTLLPRFAGATTASAHSVLTVVFFVVFLSGLLQVLLGLARLGNLIKLIPYPVTAGILSGTAVIIVVGQLGHLLGAAEPLSFATAAGALRTAMPLNLAVGALSAGVMIGVQRASRKVPGSLVGLLAGTGLYFLLRHLGLGHLLGPTVGAASAAFVAPRYALGFFSGPTLRTVVENASFVVPAVLGMCILESMDSLFAALALQQDLAVRPKANRELVAQGLGNLLSACLGGLSGSGFVGRSRANVQSGGRTRLSAIFCSLLLSLVLFLLLPWVGRLPKAATAGVIIVIAFGILDKWSLRALAKLATDRQARDRRLVANIALVFAVAAVALVFNLAIAVVAGIFLSMLVFLAGQSRSIVRRVYSGSAVRSQKQRDPAGERYLAQHGGRLAVVELQGAVFFGTADYLADRITDISSGGHEFIILDMKRVTEIDSTGAKVLQQIHSQLVHEGRTLAISYLSRKHAIMSFLRTMDVEGFLGSVELFDDTDLALERCEDRILDALYSEGWESRECPIREFEVLEGLSEEELDVFQGYLSRSRFETGQRVFAQGDDSDSMYFVEKGSADVFIEINAGTLKRLHSLSAGTVFGELALVDRQPRSAHVVATEPLVCYSLSVMDFERMKGLHPRLALTFISGISRVVTTRLRVADRMISDLET